MRESWNELLSREDIGEDTGNEITHNSLQSGGSDERYSANKMSASLS